MTANQNLSMIRGDTFTFDVAFSEMEDATISSIYFTVKRRATDETFIFQKSFADGIKQIDDMTYRIRVAPEDTSGVTAGKYVYDLQIGLGDDIYTLLMGVILIAQDVTDN